MLNSFIENEQYKLQIVLERQRVFIKVRCRRISIGASIL